MSITAMVEDGKIVLPSDVHWPTGATVRVDLLSASGLPNSTGSATDTDEREPSCLELSRDLFDGLETGGPDDLSTHPKHLEDLGI